MPRDVRTGAYTCLTEGRMRGNWEATERRGCGESDGDVPISEGDYKRTISSALARSDLESPSNQPHRRSGTWWSRESAGPIEWSAPWVHLAAEDAIDEATKLPKYK